MDLLLHLEMFFSNNIFVINQSTMSIYKAQTQKIWLKKGICKIRWTEYIYFFQWLCKIRKLLNSLYFSVYLLFSNKIKMLYLVKFNYNLWNNASVLIISWFWVHRTHHKISICSYLLVPNILRWITSKDFSI